LHEAVWVDEEMGAGASVNLPGEVVGTFIAIDQESPYKEVTVTKDAVSDPPFTYSPETIWRD
jgi:hypothetical protein